METPGTLVLSARERVLLLFLAASDERIDPIRIQKGLFILAQKTPGAWLPDDARYDFEPYNYGPFARPINSDLLSLRMKGLVRSEESWNPTWRFHAITDEGRRRAEAEGQDMDPRLIEYIASVRRFVAEKSFRELLDAVYAEFPEYAAKSVFKH